MEQNSVEWHEDCLKNLRYYLKNLRYSHERVKKEFDRIKGDLERMEKEILFKSYQINEAKRIGKTSFDRDKFKVVKEKK